MELSQGIDTSGSFRLPEDDFHEGDLPRLHLQSLPSGRVRLLFGGSPDRGEEADLFDGVEPG